MHKCLVFSIPAAAAIVAFLLWLWLPGVQIDKLMAEGDMIETWTLVAYGAAIAASCVSVCVAQDKLAAGAFVLVLVFLAAREMDLHVSLTGTSVLRLSYYLRGPFTGEKAAALAALTLFIACAGHLWLRQGMFLRRDLRAGEPVAFAVMAFCITIVAAKVLDRAPDVLTQNFGWSIAHGTASLMRSLEETLELALPLIVVAAALAHWRAKRQATQGLPGAFRRVAGGPAPLGSPGDMR